MNAIVFSGFNFNNKHLAKHVNLYKRYGARTHPFKFSVIQMTNPRTGLENGFNIMKTVNKIPQDEPIVAHVISGSFWLFLYGLRAMTPSMRNRIRGIVFDSSPPTSYVDAFAGWAANSLQMQYLKPTLMPVFLPYRALMGINPLWEEMIEYWTYGDGNHTSRGEHELIPQSAHIAFINSLNDPVVCATNHQRFVEHLTATREGRAVVTVTNLKTSRHALGIVDEPHLYRKSVCELLDRCVDIES